MKSLRRSHGLLFLLFILSALVLIPQRPVQAATKSAAAAAKNGLKQENGKYYFYTNGKKVKNTWKTVKTGNVSYRYYFGKSGAACQSPVSTSDPYMIKIYTIGNKKYGFDARARMVTGYAADLKGRMCWFSSKGYYSASATKKIRTLLKRGKKTKKQYQKIIKALGKPKKTRITGDSCNYPPVDGWDQSSFLTDVVLKYSRFMVVFVRNERTGEYYLDYYQPE